MESPRFSKSIGQDPLFPLPTVWNEVVEIPLLLPKNRAEALMALSKSRHLSVGQILRDLIEEALGEDLSNQATTYPAATA